MDPTAHGLALPSDCEVIHGRRGTLARRRDERRALDAVGFGPEGGERLVPSDLAGRHRLGGFTDSGVRYAVRHFSHGGLLRFLTGRRFADPARPFRELIHAEALTAAGIPTPAVVAARAIRARPFGFHLALVTRRVEGTVDLARALERLGAGEGGSAVRHGLVRAAGELVGRLHGLGFLHADLHPKNMLVEEGGLRGGAVRLWVLDLDRSAIHPHLSDAQRRGNLGRLLRSVRRAESRGRPWWGPGDMARFLVSYRRAAALPPAGWREDWRDIALAGARTGPWHRLGWRLERLFAAPTTS